MNKFSLAGLVWILFIFLTACNSASAEEVSFDWQSDWGVVENFAISMDTEGYNLPTSIAFVPNPGSGPKDPLYFVTELKGKVKVVTNDRTIYTFAEDFFTLEVDKSVHESEGEIGLAGICLEPKHGYVFVTFPYQDSNKILRNNIVRFQTKPETFSIEPTSSVEFAEVFSSYESASSHQIGPCQIKDDLLYVSVGDGRDSTKSQDLDYILGKIIRMTLDGEPVPDNPFYQDGDIKKAANYVWAYGLRNPFGLKIVGDRIFAADNGLHVDRFVEIHKGENYLWDGTDWSIGSYADMTFSPSISPVQLDYYPEGSSVFSEEYKQNFFVAVAGTTRGESWTGILRLEYGFEENRMMQAPNYFLRYQGDMAQAIVGLAFGPDGLYFVPILPDKAGRSGIYKVTYAPDNEHPFGLFNEQDAAALMATKGCVGCHSRNNWGGTAGPALDRVALVSRIQERLESEEYLQSVAELDRLDTEPYVNFRSARKEVLEAEGEDQVRTWIKYRLLEPRFDTRYSQMPNLGLTEREAIVIANFLVEKKGIIEEAKGLLKPLLPRSPYDLEQLLMSFGFGVLIGALLLALLWFALPLIRRLVAAVSMRKR